MSQTAAVARQNAPIELPTATRTGCGGRLVGFLAFTWVILVSVSSQLWSWAGAGFGAATEAVQITATQALQLGAPLLLLAWLWRAPRERAIYRAWFLAALYVLAIAAARSLPPVESQAVMLAQLCITAIFGLIVRFAGPWHRRVSAPPLAWYMAAGAAALVATLWVQRGAAGSPFDLLLSLLTGLAFGATFALIMQRTWFAALEVHTRGRGADLFTGGLTAAVTLLIMASALSFNGGQLMLMLALPLLGWLAVALAYGDGGYDWRPPALLVGLAAFAMLAMMDTNPLAIALADPALGQTAAAAALSAVFGLGTLAAVLFLRRNWGAPGRPTLAALAAVALWLMAGLFYVAGGNPGFHGDRLFVILKNQADVSAAVQTADYGARRQFVYSTLVDHANETQADLRQTLTRLGTRYRPYYLVNAVEVEGGLLARALLSTRADVDRILASPRLRPLPAPPAIVRGETSLPSDHGWNLSMIGADRVWRAFDVRGDGIVIGASDSGVQADHPELAASYRGRTSGSNYNWFDPWSGAAEPIDYVGHGTHTAATVTGQSVGVAPHAEWIACANLQRNVSNPALYLDCLQFMLAPFPLGGDPFEDGDPTRGAHVLNNSWGCPADEGCDPGSLEPAVDALAAAGLFVVASAGNDGPGCSSLENPIAIYDSAFTVGAVDALGNLAEFSSVGPVTSDGSGRTKPDIAAPGVAIWSAYPGGTFFGSDGTSMAGPHVAGVVALMWSANPTLIGDIERTEAILRRSTQPFSGKMFNATAILMEAMEEQIAAATEDTDATLNTLLETMQNQLGQGGGCIAQSNPAQTPNNLVGYGIVDAYAAVAAARATQP